MSMSKIVHTSEDGSKIRRLDDGTFVILIPCGKDLYMPLLVDDETERVMIKGNVENLEG